jgi:hypothetical protein
MYGHRNSSLKLYNNGENITLKRENYNLNIELSKVKQDNNFLRQEKKNLEVKLAKVQHQMQSTKKCQSHPIFQSSRSITQFPKDIEILLEKVEDDLKTQLYLKIEELLSSVTCVICHENIKSVMYIDCRHLVACIKCTENLSNKCPICRLESRKVIIYH